MTIVDMIKRRGFDLRPADGGGLFIAPIDELTDSQRDWLTNNKGQIRHQLLAERWQWFLSLASDHGIHPDVANAEFSSEQDRLDVVEALGHDDEMLRKCMETLCNDVRVQERQRNYVNGEWLPLNADSEFAE